VSIFYFTSNYLYVYFEPFPLPFSEFERDLADRQRPTARYPDTLSHAGAGGNTAGLSGIFGGSHGIGAGTHSFAPDEAGGSFSNLCERRLAFELSQHRAPEQATRSLIHR